MMNLRSFSRRIGGGAAAAARGGLSEGWSSWAGGKLRSRHGRSGTGTGGVRREDALTAAPRPALLDGEGPEPRRWLISAAIVIAVHAGLILWLAQRHDVGTAGAPPAAIMIDLPPMDAAPTAESPPQAREGPKMSEANPPELESPKPMAVPEPPRAKQPAAVLAPPHKSRPKPKAKEISPPAAKPTHASSAPPTGARKNSRAARGQTPAAWRLGEAESAASVASWSAQVRAHLLSHIPAAGGAGVVTVHFSLASSGALLGVHLAASSGSPNLDRRALEMVRQANPFPSAPSELAGGAFPFDVPVRFR